jgi:hypothetical protein
VSTDKKTNALAAIADGVGYLNQAPAQRSSTAEARFALAGAKFAQAQALLMVDILDELTAIRKAVTPEVDR